MVLLVTGYDEEKKEDITVPGVLVWGGTKVKHDPKSDTWRLDDPLRQM